MVTQDKLEKAVINYSFQSEEYREMAESVVALQIVAEKELRLKITNNVAREIILFQRKMHPNHKTAYKMKSFVEPLLNEFVEYYG